MAINKNDQINDLPRMHFIEAGSDHVGVPSAYALLNGDYSRAQDSLVIELPDGTSFFISGFFSQSTLPNLIAPNGLQISGDIAAQLAGPAMPGQYAQASGAATGAKPIGQVVALEGSVTVQRADGTVVTLSNRDFVFENDVVTTASSSTVSITFTDESVLRLSADARMILDQYVYSPGQSTGNTAVFNLISGAVGAVSGLIAPSGDMIVTTPSATLAIRGTSVLIEVTQNDTRVNLLVDIKDGTGGLVHVLDPGNQGVILQSITVNNIGQIVQINGATGAIVVSQLSPADQATLSSVVTLLTSSYTAAVNQPIQSNDGGTEDGQETPVPGDQPTTPDESPSDGQDDSGQLNNQGQETQIAIEEEGGEAASEEVELADANLGDAGDGGSPLTGGAGEAPPPPPTVVTPPVDPSLQITLPGAPAITEDSSGISLSGFSVAGNNTTPLTVSLSAFSTITITNTTGLTLVSGSFTDAETVVFTGTPDNVTNALNSILYTPTPDNDQTGGFAISVTDGTNVETATYSVPITGQPDAPVVNTPIAAQIAVEETAFSFTVPTDTFRDSDSGDTLTLTATLVGGGPLPSWLAFDGQTFSGTPDDPDIGTIDVVVTASDTQPITADVSTIFSLQVTQVNDAAVITGDVSGTANEDGSSTFGNLDYTDVDGPGAADAWQAATGLAGTFGALDIDTAGNWTYALNNANLTVNALNAGQT
ncbi:MAG: putative Ig domain-containing protein, partial [Anderseniella sp.]